MMKSVGIIVAMEEEREEIIDVMTDIQVEQVNNLRFIKGKIQGKDCILAKSGVGKVNAARTTQILIDEFDIKYIINIGVAGAVSPLLEVGDVVIGKHVVQHDFDITAFGHSKGYISGVGDKVECDKDLIDEFNQVIASLPERKYKIKIGIVATGDIFCTEVWMKDKIYSKFSADVVDMECGAIGQVCYLDNIPFIAIRSVSDTPNGKNSSDFNNNIKLASRRCANILKEFMS